MNTMVELRDGIDGLLTLNSNSIDLVLSDLPSGSTQAPFDKVPDLRRFWPAAREESRNFIGFDSDPRFGAAECFACGGTGEIDETIGGAVMARHDSHAPCPDCQNPRCRVGGPHHLVEYKS